MAKPRVLLINPPKIRRSGSGYISEIVDIGVPIGLLGIASFVEKSDIHVKVVDCVGDPKAEALNVTEKDGSEVLMYSITEKDFNERVKDFNPDVVGISGQFVSQYNEVIWTTEKIKKLLPNVKIVVGGSFLHRDLLTKLEKIPSIDICAFGEGEHTMVDITKAITNKTPLSGVRGIAWKDEKGKAHSTEKRPFIYDLDTLPLPAYHLVDMDFYLDLPKKGFYNRVKDTKRTITFITSRGCPEQCCFCSVPRVSGSVWRRNSVNYVLKHMKVLVDTYGVERLHIEDDNFTLDMKRAREIFEGMIKQGIKVEWDTLNGVRADRLDEDMLTKMKKSGCVKVCISPEVGNQKILDEVINKRLDLKDVEKTARLCKKIGLPLQAYFIIGFPGETKETIKETVLFAKKLSKKYDVIVSGALRATPFYGTPLYKTAKEKGFLKEPDPTEFDKSLAGSAGLIETDEFDEAYLDKVNKHLIRASYYYSAKRYLKNPKKLVRRFRNPYLIASTIKRFIKGNRELI